MVIDHSPAETVPLQERAGMRYGMRLQGNALLQEPLHVRMRWLRLIARDADGTAPINVLQTVNDWREVISKMLTVP